jgi:hypothetical protein
MKLLPYYAFKIQATDSLSVVVNRLAAQVELLNGIFKTRGVCLESTPFTEPQRLRKLFALLTLALCWSMRMGLVLYQLQPIQIKQQDRRAKSIFRLGFDHIRQLVLNPASRNEADFLHSLNFLSCT